jgi:hypothetical protein
MTHLTLQEVIERIYRFDSFGKDERTGHTEDQPHRPEFYVPRIARSLVNLRLARVLDRSLLWS